MFRLSLPRGGFTDQVYHGGYVLSYHAYAHWIRSFRSLPVHFVITFSRWVPLMGPRLAAHPHWHSFSSFCFPVPLCSFGTVGGCSSRSPCCELYIAPGRAGPVSRAIYPEDPSLWGTGGCDMGSALGMPPPFKLLTKVSRIMAQMCFA